MTRTARIKKVKTDCQYRELVDSLVVEDTPLYEKFCVLVEDMLGNGC